MNRQHWLVRCAVACAAMFLISGSLQAQNLLSHWRMQNPDPNATPSTWVNSVSGAPDMVYDTETKPPAIFNTEETRIELGWDPEVTTRISASDPNLDAGVNSNTFCFSMIMDPTDVQPYGSILHKENDEGALNNYEKYGWIVQHTTGGDIEFVVRGADFFTNNFFGVVSIPGSTSGFPSVPDWEDETRFHIAGGYDSTTGEAFLSVTKLDSFPITSLNKSPFTLFTYGAVQDTSPLAVGAVRNWYDDPNDPNDVAGGLVDIGTSGHDLDDLQIYDSILSDADLLWLANNPGLSLETLPGDYDGDGDVDGGDFIIWQRHNGTPEKLTEWQTHFGDTAAGPIVGAVPEPSSILLVGLASALVAVRYRQRLQ